MYRLENNFLWCFHSLGKFIPFVFVPLSFICLFACVCSLAFVRLDCWMSLIHFYLLIICMDGDGVFNEIGDRLIRRDNIKCTISQSLHPFVHTCLCVCAFSCCCRCRFYFGNFVIPFRGIVICSFHLRIRYAQNGNKQPKKKQQNINSNITNVLNIADKAWECKTKKK